MSKRVIVPVASLVVGLVAGFCLTVGSPGAAAPAPAAPVVPRAPLVEWVPPGDTIIRVTGNKLDGFGIHHLDGTALFPPTDSEAYAECEEYDTEVAVVRCRTEVRVWYRDLSKLKQSLWWAKQRYSAAA